MKTFLLNYKRPNTHTFYDLVPSDAEVKARADAAKEPDLEKRKKMISGEDEKRFIQLRTDVVLFPGVNEVSEDAYLLMVSHPSFDYNFECRPPVMEWVPGFGPDDHEMKTFAKLRDAEALNIVEAMWKQPLIEKYLAGEKREKVKAALEAQLEKLKIKPAKAA